jgi:hypothetical protein
MTNTNIIKDMKDGTEYAARQWELYLAATRRIGHTESLREANEGLGYNLVKTIPGLLEWIKELQEDNSALRRDITTRQTKTLTSETPRDPNRPIGIPEEHIIIELGETPEVVTPGLLPAGPDVVLEVVTEAALPILGGELVPFLTDEELTEFGYRRSKPRK